MANKLEAKMEVQKERQKPKKSHKPGCLCWRCGRHLVPKEEFMPGGLRGNHETLHGIHR
jgi:hypothetical protein